MLKAFQFLVSPLAIQPTAVGISLTPGADSVYGTQANDLIIAIPNDLSTGDWIDGGAGIDP